MHGFRAWIFRAACLHAANGWQPASHLRGGCGKHGQDSENAKAARRADGRLSRARARARPKGLLPTYPARARACRSIFHRIPTPQSQNAVKMVTRPVLQLDELMVYSKSLELKESKYEASLMKTL
eukprot:COSAG05_NODE_461_length_9571_cov_14.935283_5_plen_125_part_00